MKVKISGNTSQISNRPRKCIKILSHLKKEADAEGFEDIQGEFNRSFDSVNSNIEILNGSFSKLKPIGSKRLPKSSSSIQQPGNLIHQFNPGANSTPYEDISDIEAETEECREESLNTTINDAQHEVLSSTEYMQEVQEFLNKTKEMATSKTMKKAGLLKKLRKYEKKIKSIQEAVRHMDRIISFGTKVPAIISDLCKESY